MFGLHYVQTGLVSKDLARFFSDMYDRRQTGDYDDFISYDKKTSISLLISGKEFVSEIEKLIKLK